MTGKFIVIEGTDGSGKATHTKLLTERLQKEGYAVTVFDFPQYFKTSSDFVKNYLQGRYGSLEEVSPKKASLLFAMDRFEAATDIRKALSEGKIVIANRYVASNMGHQGSKFIDQKERLEYFAWLDELEFRILQIPRPDLNIVLHVPAAVAQKLVDLKTCAERAYAEGKKRDLHEASLEHLQRAEQTYLEIVKLFPQQFQLVECLAGDKLMTVSEIQAKIWQLVQQEVVQAPEQKQLF